MTTLRICRGCKTLQHRQRFVPKGGLVNGKYDTLCAACRHNTYFTPKQREKRVENGFMTPARKEQLDRQYKEKKNATILDVLEARRAAQALPTWERPEKSARMALRLLQAYVFPTPEATAWGQDAERLVRKTLEEIKQRKRVEVLPTHKLILWYDAVDGMAHELRRLCERYPGGAECAPLQVME